MNGAISGRVDGEIFDRMMYTIDDHDNESHNWVVRERRNGEFSAPGDSGSAVGVEGKAGGILLGGGIGINDVDGTQFPYSYIASVEDTLKRIESLTGRKLEVPGVYDLSHRSTRDHYHRMKTGNVRIRET